MASIIANSLRGVVESAFFVRIVDFIRWWGRMLAASFPRKHKIHKDKYCIAYWAKSKLRFAICANGQLKELGELDLDRHDIADLNANNLRAVRACRLPLVFRIDSNRGVEVIDRLPKTATKELTKILTHRLDSLSPWRHEAVHFAANGITESNDGYIEVRIAIVPRRTVLAAIEILESLSLRAETIDLEGTHWSAPPNHDLNPARHAPRLSFSVIALLIGLQIGIIIIAALARHDLEVRVELNNARIRQLALLEERLTDAAELRAQFAKLETARRSLFELINGRISPLIVIETLSRILPDTTWLDEFTIADTQLAISGFSADATLLPSLLEITSTFNSVQFTGPIERMLIANESGSAQEFERFSLRATLSATPSNPNIAGADIR